MQFWAGFFFEWILQIVSLEGTEVGRISKQWSGITREFLTTADYFGISFPVDLDVRMKAVMLGAVMLIVIYEMIRFTMFTRLNSDEFCARKSETFTIFEETIIQNLSIENDTWTNFQID